MDLARELTALAAHVDWPETPELRLALEPRRGRRPIAAALAFAAVLALFAALAVPQSRGAILRFFHLGSATIVRVDKLPAAQERPLEVGLGAPVTRADAATLLKGTLLLPSATAPLYRTGSAVSIVFSYKGAPVLLNEFPYGSGFMKKLASGGTSIEPGGVEGVPSIWISGARHDFFFPSASPRLAGNVLIWEQNGTTYRLESRSLSHADALALARSLTRG